MREIVLEDMRRAAIAQRGLVLACVLGLLAGALPVVFVAGCASAQPPLTAVELLQHRAARSAPEGVTVARAQQPDSETAKPTPSGSLLDLSTKDFSGTKEGEVAARIRATVNGVPILDQEVREAVRPALMETRSLPEPERGARQNEIVRRQLEHLIEREVILQEMFSFLERRPQVLDKLKESARKESDRQLRAMKRRMAQQGLTLQSEEEFKAFLRSQGMSLEGMRRQIEREHMAMEWMGSRIGPALERIGHEPILEYYQKHPEEFQVTDSVQWQDIFIDASKFPDRDQARRLTEETAAKARSGEDYRELVLRYDDGDSTYRNGDGYGQRPGEIKPPQAEPVLFRMQDGEITVLELANGYHILRLVKRQYAGQLPLDEKTQASIRNKLKAQVWEREYQRVIANLKRKASIEISTGGP